MGGTQDIDCLDLVLVLAVLVAVLVAPFSLDALVEGAAEEWRAV